MSRKILVMGLPGAGKTTLAASLTALMFCHDVVWFNADTIREKYNDWDFSPEGRLRQAHRMREIADNEVAKGKTVNDLVKSGFGTNTSQGVYTFARSTRNRCRNSCLEVNKYSL